MKFLKPSDLLDFIFSVLTVVIIFGVLVAGCNQYPGRPDGDEPTEVAFREVRIEGCQYLQVRNYKGDTLTHKGNCDNHGTPVKTAIVTCSFYADSYAGKPTASGEIYDPSLLTAASRQFPLNTRLRVTFEGHSVIVRVNDRTHARYADRLDLSRAAFQQLASLEQGIVNATIEVLP